MSGKLTIDNLVSITRKTLPALPLPNNAQVACFLPDGSIWVNSKQNTWVEYNSSKNASLQIIGNIRTDQSLEELNFDAQGKARPDGVYKCQTEGKYNTSEDDVKKLVAKKGYITYFRKAGIYWSLESETEMPKTEVSKNFDAENTTDPAAQNATANWLYDLDLVEKSIENITQIKPTPTSKFTAAGTIDNRTYYAWFKGVSTKKINKITIPITSVYDGSKALTDSVFVKVGLNNNFIFSTEITLAQMTAQGIDTTSSVESKMMYIIDLPEVTINKNDIIFVGVSCKSPTDKLGFVATNILSDEWINGYNSNSNSSIIDLTSPPSAPITNGDWAYNVSFSYYGETFTKKETASKSYVNVENARKSIGSFLEKWRLKEDLKVVCYGNSLTQFQNSETLTIAEQQVNPIGLAGNSWVRQLWQMLNYKDSDLAFKRFDHADFTFSNGIQTKSSAIGSFGWATNRNDGESWRGENGGAVFAQSIMPDSSFGKPLVGTNKSGESFTVTIPATATEVSLVFVATQYNKSVNIKINNGTSDIVSESVILNPDNLQPTENRKRYTFASGSIKTITVTNGDGVLWFWGIEYKSKATVKVINQGSGGYHIDLLKEDWKFNGEVKNYNPDLLVFEAPYPNDQNFDWTLSDHAAKIKILMDKITALKIPVLVIFPHRFTTAFINSTETPEVTQRLVKYLPEAKANYQFFAESRGFATIDLLSKSIDLWGDLNTVSVPQGYLLDAGHLGKKGNEMWVEELIKIFTT